MRLELIFSSKRCHGGWVTVGASKGGNSGKVMCLNAIIIMCCCFLPLFSHLYSVFLGNCIITSSTTRAIFWLVLHADLWHCLPQKPTRSFWEAPKPRWGQQPSLTVELSHKYMLSWIPEAAIAIMTSRYWYPYPPFIPSPFKRFAGTTIKCQLPQRGERETFTPLAASVSDRNWLCH